MKHNGTYRTYTVVGLTGDNFVILANEEGVERTTCERPSEYIGITYLTRKENAILNRGLTRAGRNRERPR